MISKLKNAVSNLRQQQKQQQPKKNIDISLLNPQQLKTYKKIFQSCKQNINSFDSISKSNKQGLLSYLDHRDKQSKDKQNHQPPPPDQNDDLKKFTVEQDLKQIKQILHELQQQFKQILTILQQAISRVYHHDPNDEKHSLNTNKNIQEIVNKYEIEILLLKKSEENNKQILSTLSQKNQLSTKEVRQLQDKCIKYEKQLNDKNKLIDNLKQQKIVLLEMRNNTVTGQLPQVQSLKTKITQYQKRLLLQKTKIQQKQKQIQSIKKKMQQDHQSLQKIADQLKQKQLKSKKIIDKYQRSKTQIRKFRQQKTQFIKQLNIQITKITQQLTQQKKKNTLLKQSHQQLFIQIDNLKSQLNKNQNQKIQLESNQTQLLHVRKQLYQKNIDIQKHQQQLKKFKQTNDQLQQKRKQLLQALEKPITHQIHTLQKILKALDKLYKDYITNVFQEGNIVGFQSRITYIISNVQQIKEDLMM